MRFIASVNAIMIIVHEVSGSHGGIMVDGEERDIRRFVEYAKMNPYSVYKCPGESGEAIEKQVGGMFKGRWPEQFKQETRLLPMRMAFIKPDQVIPAKMADVIRRLQDSNREIKEFLGEVRAAKGSNLGREYFFERSTVASPVPEDKLWRSLFITATDCAIYALKELAFGTTFAAEANKINEGLFGVQTITEGLMNFMETSGMNGRYKAILRAWPTTA